MFAFGVAFDLLPDADLKQRIAAATRRIMDHIVSNGYYLVDVDGQPTTWGKWSPKYFAEDPEDSALNALELLSFLKTTAHVTGDQRYEAEYRKVAHDLGYAKIILRLHEVRKEMNYSDEELAMLPFYGVFRYERDEAMLGPYRQALDDWWQNMQRELCPLWTFIYLTGRPDAKVDLEGAVWTLYRMPMDLDRLGREELPSPRHRVDRRAGPPRPAGGAHAAAAGRAAGHALERQSFRRRRGPRRPERVRRRRVPAALLDGAAPQAPDRRVTAP